MKSAIKSPGMLITESAIPELDALQRRQQKGVYVIIGTLIFGFLLPVVAVFGYIIVSIVFFLTPTITVAKTTLGKDK